MKHPFLLATCLCALTLSHGSAQDKKYNLATVVKISGINWFNYMETGVKKFAQDTGNQTVQLGPPVTDSAQQNQIVEDLIAKKVDAICVVPFQPPAMEPVLKKAMDNKIVVIAHEASDIQNASYDIEAFDNGAFGEHLMQNLAKRMNEEGEYAVFVGSLTSKTHNQWADAAIAFQKKNYPKMKLVVDKIETNDDQQVSYAKAKELLRAHPNIKGFQGSASTDAPGCGLAVEEAGLQEKVAVVGTGVPSLVKKYLPSGAVRMISFWDSSIAGYLMNKVAVMVLNGQKVTDGMDLGFPGYEKIKLVDNKIIYGNGWIDCTKDNMDKFNF
ncbi:MAG TPA: autoinducer 2 ABC transporter substrate-binding protein [Chthoniobacterales bacterium]